MLLGDAGEAFGVGLGYGRTRIGVRPVLIVSRTFPHAHRLPPPPDELNLLFDFQVDGGFEGGPVAHADASGQVDFRGTQSELHPLEEGKHAAESGMDLKAYAEASGKARETLSKKLMAWRVLSVVHMDHKNKATHALMDHHYGNGDMGEVYRHSGAAEGLLEDAREHWRNLAEIHAAPDWLWPALVDASCIRSRRANTPLSPGWI